MPVEKTHEKKEPEKKEKVNMGKRAYDLLNAERMRVAREERLAAAEEQRQRDRQHELRMIKEKVERDRATLVLCDVIISNTPHSVSKEMACTCTEFK
jgi:N-acetyl-gamma-glutamylphosphate reductase